MTTTSKTNLLCACLLVAAGVWSVSSRSAPAGPDAAAPEAALQTAVAPVKAIHVEAADARKLAGFYRAMADVVERDAAGVIATTQALRNLNTRAGGLCFQQSGISGKYAGLAEAIDGVLAARLGVKVVPLDAAARAEAVATLRAIAWALGG